MKHPLAFLALTFAASVAIYTPGCGGADEPGSTSAPVVPGPATDDVLFENGTNPEALVSLLSATPTVDVVRAASVTWPGNGELLPASPAFCFEWDKPKTGLLSPSPSPAIAPLGAPAFSALFGPPHVAHAEGATFTGEAYFVVFSSSTDDKLVRVFTSSKAYMPSEAAWAKLRAARGTLRLEVTTAVFANNKLSPAGGPYSSSSLTFLIAM